MTWPQYVTEDMWPQYLTDDMKALLAKAKKDRKKSRKKCAKAVKRGVMTQEQADFINGHRDRHVKTLAKFVASLPGGKS